MNNENTKVYTLFCDIDSADHGCFSSLDKVIDVVNKMIEKQPFWVHAEVSHFYSIMYEVDSGKEGEMINMEDVIPS
jgi:hypothetical protein